MNEFQALAVGLILGLGGVGGVVLGAIGGYQRGGWKLLFLIGGVGLLAAFVGTLVATLLYGKSPMDVLLLRDSSFGARGILGAYVVAVLGIVSVPVKAILQFIAQPRKPPTRESS